MRLLPAAGLAAALTASMLLATPAVAATVTGTSGDDTLVGTLSADVIKGLAGDDSMWGRRGGDVMQGGNGADRLSGMRGRDKISGGPGADRAYGQRDSDTIDDAIGASVDVLSGGPGADRIFANFRDKVYGGAGDDRIEYVYPSTGQISCGDGNDTVVFNQPHDDVALFSCEHVEIVSAG
jgi:Ca2+-binding RTX toxin-like protein